MSTTTFTAILLNYHGDEVQAEPASDMAAAEMCAQDFAEEALDASAPGRCGCVAVVHGPMSAYHVRDGRVVYEPLAVPAAEVEALRAELAEARAELARLRQPQEYPAAPAAITMETSP